MNLYEKRFEIRFIQNKVELIESQKLRHKVFIEEMGGSRNNLSLISNSESDKFDDFCRHLIIIDHKNSTQFPNGKIIGVTRLMLTEDSENGIGFYCSQEFNLNPIISTKKECLEIGRICIHNEYRNTLVLHYLWIELGSFCSKRGVKILFGVASFTGNNIKKIEMALSHIHNDYLAPPKIRPMALEHGYIKMNMVPKEEINKLNALKQMPSLLKSYLRLGAKVGEGAFIDKELNTIDILIMLDVSNMTNKYKLYYEKS